MGSSKNLGRNPILSYVMKDEEKNLGTNGLVKCQKPIGLAEFAHNSREVHDFCHGFQHPSGYWISQKHSAATFLRRIGSERGKREPRKSWNQKSSPMEVWQLIWQ